MKTEIFKKILLLIWISLISVSTLFSQEICNNGIDDDGDGLIDFFDPDCQSEADADENFFYNKSIPTCSAKPPVFYTWTLQEKFNTNEANGGTLSGTPPYPVDQRCGLFVGDLDGDGVSELVGKDGSDGVHVFSGVTGKHIAEYAVTSHSYSQVALGDVDNDGNGDIFLVNNSGNLVRLVFDKTTKTLSLASGFTQNSAASSNRSPQLADFDNDGIPEVYVGGIIFNSLTGEILVTGSGNVGKHSQSDAWPIAYNIYEEGDLDPDGTGVFGSDAAGLELVAGNQIYLVANNSGTWSMSVAAEILSSDITTSDAQILNGDGYTSLGDLNGDKRTDIIVTTNRSTAQSYIYAYDPISLAQIGTAYAFPTANKQAGRCNVADFDGDGELEIGAAGKNEYVVLETDLTLKWLKSGLDDGSAQTGSTVFDFEGDGSAEVVYSDEDILYVWKGADGRELASIASPSGTRTDYPLVADVDNDGQAEIAITAQYVEAPSNSPGKGWISVFRSADAPWVAARETWNQHGYFVTNVEDDLSIPLRQQDFVSPWFNNDFNTAFNQFLVQTTYMTYEAQPTFATGDLTTENVEFNLNNCPITHEVNFTLTFENNGSWKIPRNTPVSYYDGDPYQPGAVYLDSTHISDNIEPGQEYVMEDMVYDENEDGKMDLYVLVNHSHFTVDGTPLNLPLVEGTINSPTLECDYDNNLGFIVSLENCVAVSTPEIDLDRNNSSGVLGNDYQIGFAIGEATTFNVADADVFIRDTDSPNNLRGAIITLTNLLDTGDENLGITTDGQDYADEYGITVNITASVITLSGLGNSLLEYERVIKNITYSNSKESPDMTTRVITFEVQDEYSSNTPLAQTSVIYTYRPELDLDPDNSSGGTGKDYQATFTEGDGQIAFVDTDVSFTDSDGITISEAIVTLTNKVDGTEEDIDVPFSLPAGILRDFNELTPGKVRLYGTASLANYQSAIASLSYRNDNEDPTAGDRIIEVVINDGYLDSEKATATITVVPVNDNPVISGALDAAVYASGNLTVLPYPEITDVDNELLKSATVTITTGFVSGGEDQLSFTEDHGVAGSFDSSTGVLSLSGEATIAEYKEIISTVQFSSTLATYTGNRAVSIKVTDNDDGESNVFHRTIILINNPGNDAPYAADDAYEVFKSNTLSKVAPGVLSNDLDPDGDGVTVSPTISTTGSFGGALTVNADGSFTYDPDESNSTVVALNYGETAIETFTYFNIDDESVESGTSSSNEATITFTIKGENATPVANDDSYTVDQDGEIITSSPGLLNNDTDADGVTRLEVVQVSQSYNSVIYGQYGSFVWYGDGSFVYTPNQSNPDVQALQVTDTDLVETFVYTIEDPNFDSDDATVTINIQGTNDAPYVYAEDADELTNKNTSLTFNEANNNKIYVTDNDGDDQRITITVTNGTLTLGGTSGLSNFSGNGTASVTFDGSLADVNAALLGSSFSPTSDFTGTANITVQTQDLVGGTPVETDSEVININVIDPNTAPVVTILNTTTFPTSQTIQEDAQVTFVAGTATKMSVADSDGDDQTVTITITNGVLTLTGTSGVTITGNGSANITFTGTLAQVNEEMDGAVFTPTQNYSGSASVQVYTNDGKGGSHYGIDNITINDVDEAPVANNDSKTILEDASVIIYALANDEDKDGNGISIISNTDVSNGSLTNNGDGTFTYVPDANFNGSDSFTYTIEDGDASNPDSDNATVSITVTPVNDAPSFTKGADQTIDENTSGVQTVSSWATDLDAGATNESGQTLSFNVSSDNNSLFATQPAIDASGNLTYELASDVYGVATVTVSISDNGGTDNGGDDTSDDQTFTITVNPQPKVSISVDKATIQEATSETATFTISLNHVSDQIVTVDLAFSGTANLTSDYTRSGTQVQIPVGETSADITVTAEDDDACDNGINETIVVDIDAVTNGVEDGAQQAETEVVDKDTKPSIGTSNGNNPTTCGGTNGNIVLGGLDANTEYSVNYKFGVSSVGPVAITSDGSGNLTISNLLSGSYTDITVTLGNCTSDILSGPITLTDPIAPSTPIVSVTAQPTCSLATGTITVSSSTTDLNFSIDGSDYSNTSGIFTRLAAGDYTVTARNAAGCVSNASATLTVDAQPSTPSVPTASVTAQPSCSLATGTITVSSSTTDLNFSIDGSDYSNTSGIFTGLAAGDYTVTARNAAGCVSNASATLTVDAQP
ncbi:tandem-95 repeat protein, partial [Labilibacter sediminis]